MNRLINVTAYLGLAYGNHHWIEKADMIIVLDCDVPWIPTLCKPTTKAIWHIDVDPMKQQMPVFYIDARARYKADAETILKQLNQSLRNHVTAYSTQFKKRYELLAEESRQRLEKIAKLAEPRQDGLLTTAFVAKKLKVTMPEDAVVCIEAVTQTGSYGEFHSTPISQANELQLLLSISCR